MTVKAQETGVMEEKVQEIEAVVAEAQETEAAAAKAQEIKVMAAKVSKNQVVLSLFYRRLEQVHRILEFILTVDSKLEYSQELLQITSLLMCEVLSLILVLLQ